MGTSNDSAVVGIFSSRPGAEGATRELRCAGFTADQIRVVLPETGGAMKDEPVRARDAGTVGGAAVGSMAGGTVGTVIGLVAAVASIPATGPVLSGGFLAWIVAGAGCGAVAGALGGT